MLKLDINLEQAFFIKQGEKTLNKKILTMIFLVLLVLALTIVVTKTVFANLATHNARPGSGLSASPNSALHLCPTTANRGTLIFEVNIEGLVTEHVAELQLQADTEQTAACLATYETECLQVEARNGSQPITLTEIPDGFYKLTIDAPAHYFRDPAGYLFQVRSGQIVRHPGFVFRFHLVPLSEQRLPPCREFEKAFTASSSALLLMAETIPAETQKDACWSERTIDISSPPKQPERPQEVSVSSVGYHYIGPVTTQDNQGVWGRNTVVDSNVPHPEQAGQRRFIVERVYADNGDRWMEAGWAEVSWRDDRQYIYEYDYVHDLWTFFDEYALAPGSQVETDVQYDANLGVWKARYYLDDNYWRVLAMADLGITTADRGFNRGEVYTADGVHPILPLSSFDKGYLLIDSVWRMWDTRYLTEIGRDAPYQCDMIEEHHRFNIHSPIVSIPLVMKDAQ